MLRQRAHIIWTSIGLLFFRKEHQQTKPQLDQFSFFDKCWSSDIYYNVVLCKDAYLRQSTLMTLKRRLVFLLAVRSTIACVFVTCVKVAGVLKAEHVIVVRLTLAADCPYRQRYYCRRGREPGLHRPPPRHVAAADAAVTARAVPQQSLAINDYRVRPTAIGTASRAVIESLPIPARCRQDSADGRRDRRADGQTDHTGSGVRRQTRSSGRPVAWPGNRRWRRSRLAFCNTRDTCITVAVCWTVVNPRDAKVSSQTRGARGGYYPLLTPEIMVGVGRARGRLKTINVKIIMSS